jgi:endogenous inhibitor of DNA gyrase (YacG/DUF329 family)
MSQNPAERRAACPSCGQPALLTPANSFRPFCSERCKLLDFGAWVSQRYSIPASPDTGDDDAPQAPLQ